MGKLLNSGFYRWDNRAIGPKPSPRSVPGRDDVLVAGTQKLPHDDKNETLSAGRGKVEDAEPSCSDNTVENLDLSWDNSRVDASAGKYRSEDYIYTRLTVRYDQIKEPQVSLRDIMSNHVERPCLNMEKRKRFGDAKGLLTVMSYNL